MSTARIQTLKDELGRSAERVQQVTSRLDDRTAVGATENPTWRVRDILAHLVASEPGIVANARGIIGGSGGVPADFRLDDWNVRQVAKRAEITRDALLSELADNRQKTVAFLDGVADQDLDRRGRHADLTEMSVEELLRTMMRHEQGHIAEIERALGGE